MNTKKYKKIHLIQKNTFNTETLKNKYGIWFMLDDEYNELLIQAEENLKKYKT